MHKLCPNSLGCLLESGSPVSIGLIFPIPARPGLSGVRSTAGELLACSPNVFPSVEAELEVVFPIQKDYQYLDLPQYVSWNEHNRGDSGSTAIVVMYLMFIFKMIKVDYTT